MNLDVARHHDAFGMRRFSLRVSNSYVELDADDLHVIRHALNCYAETTSIPQHATPLRKLADLITEALKP